MYNTKRTREDEIFKLAIEAFKKNVLLQVNVEPLVKQPQYNLDFRPDMELGVTINGQKIKYCAEIKNTLTQTNIMLLVMQKQKLPHPLLLIANYVNPVMAEGLTKNGIEFIDTAGNAFINQPPVYIFVKGNKPAKIPGKTPVKMFKPTGLKILYAFLCNPKLAGAPFREIAKKTNVALGTVGWFMGNLRELGFLIDMGGKDCKLFQKDTLFQRWITAYHEQLRPKQILGRYKGENHDWWNKKQLHNLNAKWGGEVAAAKMTEYLHPEIITIYTKAEYLNQLLFECKLKKDPAGNVEILNQFWEDDEKIKYGDMVHPILVYADLIATGNQRNIETAKIIYDKYIVKLIRDN